jgi:hypothetical protein
MSAQLYVRLQQLLVIVGSHKQKERSRKCHSLEAFLSLE